MSSWPMTLTLTKPDLDILPLDLHTKIHTDTHTDIRTQATYDPHGRVFLMCYSQWYEGTFCTTNFSYI